MKSKAANANPPRWRETTGAADAGGLSARAADLADAARDVPPLAPEALARIEAEVLARGSSRPLRTLPLMVRLASLAVVLLASLATARATVSLWRQYVAPAPAPAPAASLPPVRQRPRPRPTEVLAPPSPAPLPIPAPRPTAPHPRRAAMVAPRHEKDVVKPTATPPETEARLLARALARLRQDHDAAGAVALLDQYARAFPDGMLEAEAFGVRIEAAIQMDDRRTALRLLDGRNTFAGRLGGQQVLTRAELRASAGRYADALGDFDWLLGPAAAAASAPADLERALYGRAVCLGRLGRHDRARADLAAYAQRFPRGKYAREVARLLESPPPERRP